MWWALLWEYCSKFIPRSWQDNITALTAYIYSSPMDTLTAKYMGTSLNNLLSKLWCRLCSVLFGLRTDKAVLWGEKRKRNVGGKVWRFALALTPEVPSSEQVFEDISIQVTVTGLLSVVPHMWSAKDAWGTHSEHTVLILALGHSSSPHKSAAWSLWLHLFPCVIVIIQSHIEINSNSRTVASIKAFAILRVTIK